MRFCARFSGYSGAVADDRDEMKPGDEAPAGDAPAAENVCPECSGSGEADGGTCENCLGTGVIEEAVGGG